MKFRSARSAEGGAFLPGAAGTASLAQKAAAYKEQKQPTQTPYQSQQRPQQCIHLGPFGRLVQPSRYQKPPYCK